MRICAICMHYANSEPRGIEVQVYVTVHVLLSLPFVFMST